MAAKWGVPKKKASPAKDWLLLLAEQGTDPDTGVDPAFVDHLDRDIDDHREADIGDPAVAFDIFGDDVRREAHQGDGKDQPDDQDARMLARRTRDREHI